MSRQEQINPIVDKQSKYKNLSCSFCNSQNIKKRGLRHTKNRGNIQRYFCKDCKKHFVINDGFYRMRNSENKITLCLDLFFRGISTRSIQKHLQAFYHQNSSWVSIYEWIIKYSNLINEFTNKLNVQAGNELMSDEVEYRRRISHKAKLGIEPNWFVDVMDTKTRYIISSNYMQSRTIENMSKVLALAKQKTGNQVNVVTTDGLAGYPRILRKTFGLKSPYQATSKTRSKIIHNVVISDERGFNHKIERLHNNIRARTKVFRGFHGSLYSAQSIMKGWEIYYNFIRVHQAINKCPYELAIPTLKLENNNKWLELIQLSKGLKK